MNIKNKSLIILAIILIGSTMIVINAIEKINILIHSSRIIYGNPFLKGAGIEGVLPSSAIEIADILQEKNLHNYQLSTGLLNSEDYQRIIEFTYPKRLSINSNNKFYFIDESVDCNIVVIRSLIKYGTCSE